MMYERLYTRCSACRQEVNILGDGVLEEHGENCGMSHMCPFDRLSDYSDDYQRAISLAGHFAKYFQGRKVTIKLEEHRATIFEVENYFTFNVGPTDLLILTQDGPMGIRARAAFEVELSQYLGLTEPPETA